MTAYQDMTKLSPILREEPSGWMHFWCPGCNSSHTVNVKPDNHSIAWGYNGNPEKPTFTPSILGRGKRFSEKGKQQHKEWVDAGCPSPRGYDFEAEDWVCHSFVTDGRIQFLGDCTHALAGQTVDLPEWPFDYD